METTSAIDNSAPFTAAETADDDISLVRACKQGDAAAFEELVERYDRMLFRVAQHVTHNREDAQDAVQEAFLKAFRKLSQFQEKSRFSTWLIRITINESLMKLRKQHAAKEVSIDEDFHSEEDTAPFQVADRRPDPEELYGGSELRDLLRRSLQELQPGIRMVFVLRDVEGLSTEKTAEVLRLTEATVKSRLVRARRKLRERLSRYFRKSAESGNLGFNSATNRAQGLYL